MMADRYNARCLAAASAQGLDPAVAALVEAKVPHSVEQTGGFVMLITSYTFPAEAASPWVGVSCEDGFLIVGYHGPEDEGAVIAEGVAAEDVPRFVAGFHQGGGKQLAQWRWVHNRPAPTIVANRRSKDGPLIGRQLPKGEGENIGGRDWVDGPPEHQMPGRPREDEPRLAQPGHKNEEAMPECPGRMEGAVRVSVEEASVLQGFPADYPWQGTRTAIYRQIGDAVPPPLARAVIMELER